MPQTLGASQSKGNKFDGPGKHKCVQQAFVAFNFIFGCELGRLQQGVKHANVDMDKIVHSVLPTAECETSGAYFAVHNCLPAQRTRVTTVQSGVFAIPCGRKVDLFWQIFTVTRRDDDDD